MLALMIRRKPSAGLAAALLAAAAMAGCGGGGEELSAEELVARGDELCRHGQERFVEIQTKPPANAAAASEQTGKLVGVAEDELGELRDLEPPEELRSAYEEYLETRARAIDFLERGNTAAEERDAEDYGAAQDGIAAETDERRRLARTVGFESCSQPPASRASGAPG
jgi:hypothetical protein